MPRVGVLEFEQDHPEAAPVHFVRSDIAAHFCNYYYEGKKAVVRIAPRVIRICITGLTFAKLKALFRATLGPKPIPRIKPPRRPEGLLLYYPITDQRTVHSSIHSSYA